MNIKENVGAQSALASDIFDRFCAANTLKSILSQYRELCRVLRLKPTYMNDFYPRLRSKLCSWRAQGLWPKFEKRATYKCYGRGKLCSNARVLIIGAGPCGLRTAIEAQLLGAKVVVVEKRDRFSRNNVLHLWPFVITDLKGLGAKKFYGKFCAGSIDHISIRQLQCILLKVALLLGVEVHEGVSFERLSEPTDNEGWRMRTSPPEHPVSHYTFDVLIGADGRRNTLDGFPRKEMRAKLAIAITANFINKHTEAEARVKEISGVSYIFNQKFFQDLNEETSIDLENIVYYKDETHYFVMTAKKGSLLEKNVLRQDYTDTAKLLSHENINKDALERYALEAALYSTENQLPHLEFAVNHYGKPDVAMFDFTAMYAAENACKVIQRNGYRLLMTLVGDSLLEPFWPTGSGCARGFLSSFDACWMIRSWCSKDKSELDVIAERESIYRLLGQTTPENLNKEHSKYTIDPHSRYHNLNLKAVLPFQVKALYDSDEKVPDVQESYAIEKLPKKRRRDTVIANDTLITWIRNQIACYGLEISCLSDVINDGDILCAIIHRFRPDLIEFPFPSEENLEPVAASKQHKHYSLQLFQKEFGIKPIDDNPDPIDVTKYLSQIFEIFRGEIPQIKFARVDSSEELEDCDRSNASNNKLRYYGSKGYVRKNKFSIMSKGSRDRDSSESMSRRHKKRRSEDRSSRNSSRDSLGREPKPSFGSNAGLFSSEERSVPGLAKDLEEKFRGVKQVDKKPKDLTRAIGRIENSDWNIQKLQNKMAENKGYSHRKQDRDEKVPKWSREKFVDKREAMKQKIEGKKEEVPYVDKSGKATEFDESFKKLTRQLQEGNVLETGQRGSNKVAQMAEQLVHKLDRPEPLISKPTGQKPFELPTKGNDERCHFCKTPVYAVEKMTAEGKHFHKACFRCEHCNTPLRVGNYVYNRDSRYTQTFFCSNPHIHDLQKKQGLTDQPDTGLIANAQGLAEMDDRGTTPERAEFENSVDYASDEEEIDEDEWTDKNFGASNADNNDNQSLSDDDASSSSDDDTPEGIKVDAVDLENLERDGSDAGKESENSESNTMGDDDGGEESDIEDFEEDEDEVDDEDEDEGSTTEIETDSEFAEDPPHSVPGIVPKIVVQEAEKSVTKIIETPPVNSTKQNAKVLVTNVYSRDEDKQRVVDPFVVKTYDRPMPRIHTTPRKWEPLGNQGEIMGSKNSMELKKKYLHGGIQFSGSTTKFNRSGEQGKQFKNVLDLISEQQKLLQPAPKPSATMQAYLERTARNDHFNKGYLAGIKENPLAECNNDNIMSANIQNSLSNANWIGEKAERKLDEEVCTMKMNRLNLEKTFSATDNLECAEKGNFSSSPEFLNGSNDDPMILSTPSASQSQGTIVDVDAVKTDVNVVEKVEEKQEINLYENDDNNNLHQSDLDDDPSETDSQASISDYEFNDCGAADGVLAAPEPPRVEIEDEFGVTLSLDAEETGVAQNYTPSTGIYSTETENLANVLDDDTISTCSSKDSLNSGVFLETEFSDMAKDVEENKLDKSCGNSVDSRNFGMKSSKASKAGQSSFSIENIDFADIDARSIPESSIGDADTNRYFQLTNEIEDNVCGSSCNDGEELGLDMGGGVARAKDEKINGDNQCIDGNAGTKAMFSSRIPVLDSIHPFSKARDSLDYRKTRNFSNKDLYSDYQVPSLRTNVLNEVVDDIGSLKPSTSPVTARKIEALQKEKVKQSDLIKSMVLGKIKRNPDRMLRRSSKDSQSPSSKGSKEDELDLGHRDSLGSVHSPSQDGDELCSSTPSTESSSRNNSSSRVDSIEAQLLSESGPSTTESTSHESGDSVQVEPLMSQQSPQSQRYERVFKCPSIYRNRTMLEKMSTHSTDTPVVASFSVPVTQECFDGAGEEKERVDVEKTGFKSNVQPNCYRSMPDLSVFSAKGTATGSVHKEKMKEIDLESPTPRGLEPKEVFLAKSTHIERDNYKGNEKETDAETSVATSSRGSEYNPDTDASFLSRMSATSVPSTPTRGFSFADTTPFDSIKMKREMNMERGDPFMIHSRAFDSRFNDEKKYEVLDRQPCSIDPNWFLGSSMREMKGDFGLRCRSNTFSDLKSVSQDTHKGNGCSAISDISGIDSSRVGALVVAPSTSPIRSPPSSSNDDPPSIPCISLNSTENSVNSKVKALSSDTLIDNGNDDAEPVEYIRGVSVPNIASTATLSLTESIVTDNSSICNLTPVKSMKKSKDRERRKSVIRTLSDFIFLNKNGGNCSMTSSSDAATFQAVDKTSPSKEKFSILGKLLGKRKSKEANVGSGMYERNPQHNVEIKCLSSSPTPLKSSRSKSIDMNDGSGLSYVCKERCELLEPFGAIELKEEKERLRKERYRNIQSIQLKLDKIQMDQKLLKNKVLDIEKKMLDPIRSNPTNKLTIKESQDELWEEWLQTYRERSKYARLELEYLVELDELNLQERKDALEEMLDTCIELEDREHSRLRGNKIGEITKEIQSVEERKAKLRQKFQENLKKYDAEDAQVEARLAESNFSPKESDV